MINTGAKKKICIVVSSLGTGGAERSSALLSELLYTVGYDIHIVSVLDNIDYPFKGQLLNLGKLKAKNDSFLGRLKRFFIFKNYLKSNDFDYIIDNRTRIGFFKELVVSKFVYNPSKTIYCVRNFNTSKYIHPNQFLGKSIYKSAYKIVCVAHAISSKLEDLYNFKNLEVIPNPTPEVSGGKDLNNNQNEFILFYGRLDDEHKNISLLLEAYSISDLPKKDMKLKILGNGKDEAYLKRKVNDLKLTSKVEFLDFQKDPYNLVKSAYFTILTSRYEGFPRVLVESLSIGTPVVSVDCKSGPNEIIIDEHNGLLVENYNVQALVEAMNRMLDDKDLYLRCKSNAKPSVEKFSKDAIALQWQSILK